VRQDQSSHTCIDLMNTKKTVPNASRVVTLLYDRMSLIYHTFRVATAESKYGRPPLAADRGIVHLELVEPFWEIFKSSV
jgi:hypothetical protein